MNKERLFQSLSEEDKATLLALLENSYDYLNHDDRDSIFGEYVQQMRAKS